MTEPEYFGKCGNCGTKRSDPLVDACESCGQAYMLSNMPVGTPQARPCKHCGKPVLWITMAKSGKNMPVNPTIIQIVSMDGQVVRGHVSHHATCEKRPVRRAS